MRRFLVLGAIATLAATTAANSPAQDFDPHGRRRAIPRQVTTSEAQPKAGPPSDAHFIDRYTRLALTQPGAPFPLQRLAELYRERDGNIAKLLSDFEARAAQAGPEQYGATVSLAGLYKLDGRSQDAVVAYTRASAMRDKDPTPILALARLHQDVGDIGPARARFEQALALEAATADKEQTLRTLIAIALDQKDWEGAKGFHRALVGMESGSFFVKGELGRELFNRGEYERAEAELKQVVAAAAGDNRALAPALRELGRAQAKAHEKVEALATLTRALEAAGAQNALRAQIYEIIAEVFRADQELPVLIRQLEAEHPNDFPRLSLLGGLYEETGDSSKAIETYRRALGVEPHQLDLRLRMIRLLQANGDLDKALVEYDGLIHAAPNNPEFVFEECEALLQRGDKARALRLVTEVEARAAGDEEALARVAEFYGRMGERERSMRTLQRLAMRPNADPGRLVDLGDRYFQDQNVPLAVQTWKRILLTVQPRAKALAALGDVYLEHDMTAEALSVYKEAIALDPAALAYKKALAAAYERTHAYREARVLYQEIVAKAKETGDKALARECRARIVTLWGLERVLEQELPILSRQFASSPPDVEAGRLLAEVQLHLRRLDGAEMTERRVIELAPGDAESYLTLERILVQEGKVAEAIAVLEALAQVEPKRARELYERMAQYALQIYKDEDAIRYAARAVELNPDDAEGHRRLGALYRSKQEVDRAIAEFRAAIAKNDQLFPVYFELADLLLSKGQSDAADRLFRRVVRGAPDDDLVARAARLSMQINLGKGTLESLEQDLLPLAIGNPQRAIYRRLLVEIYGSLTFGLVQRVRHGAPADAQDARIALSRIGSRAVKPLLDALADPDIGQQRIAVDVLGYVENRNASLPLFAYATGAGDPELRTRAMIACGALGDPSLVTKYEAVLYPKEQADRAELSDSVAGAAVWGLARIRDRRALPILRRIAREAMPASRALAVLGLGMAGDRASIPDVVAVAASPDAGNVARAAAAFSLGKLGATAEVPTLLLLATEGDPLPRRMALAALARLAGNIPDARIAGPHGEVSAPAWRAQAVQAMTDAAFPRELEGARGHAEADALARTAVAGLASLARSGDARHAAEGPEGLPVPEGALDVTALLDRLVPMDVPEADREAALVRFADSIERSALAALRSSGDRARAVLDALGSGQGELAPFVGPRAGRAAAEQSREILAALEASIVPLARHPNPAVRAKAIVLIAGSPSDAASEAMAGALEDADEAVQRVALGAVAGSGVPWPRAAAVRAAGAVAHVLGSHENWAMRVLAARALGRLGAAGAGADAEGPLASAAAADAYALVRQAALESLASFDVVAGRHLAEARAIADPEPRVQEAARAIVAGVAPP